MRLVTDYRPLYDRIAAAAHGAGQDTLSDVQARLPRRTGNLAASTHLEEVSAPAGSIRMRITSGLPYAGAVERGADVGPRRGPHMRGDGGVVAATGPRFIDHMTGRLRVGM